MVWLWSHRHYAKEFSFVYLFFLPWLPKSRHQCDRGRCRGSWDGPPWPVGVPHPLLLSLMASLLPMPQQLQSQKERISDISYLTSKAFPLVDSVPIWRRWFFYFIYLMKAPLPPLKFTKKRTQKKEQIF